MYYSEEEARRIISVAGLKLRELNLVSRTWGNISARISENKFIVTPSGIPYDKIKPEDLPIIDITTRKYEGGLRPSDEFGIHADAYALHPDVNYVIHTHQPKASAVGCLGMDIKKIPECYRNVLGKVVPCGGYGLPSTETLCKGVRSAEKRYPDAKAVLMIHHGTACFGKDEKEAIDIACTLEKLCDEILKSNYLTKSKKHDYDKNEMLEYYLKKSKADISVLKSTESLGDSRKTGKNKFILYLNDKEQEYPIKKCPDYPASIHAEIYRNTDNKYISHLTDGSVKAVSAVKSTLLPMLDDFSQIAGVTIKSSAADAKDVSEALKGRNAVIIKNNGAVIATPDMEDIAAISEIFTKDCECEIASAIKGRGKPLPFADRIIMRIMYTKWYTKQYEKSLKK